ncbi:MAG: hypothetical protein K6360_07440 [Deltaproteobacteria bacterium]
MARKENSSAREIDLSSFEFVQNCGGCHPGGGPAEYDRNGNRYDLFAQDPNNGIVSGGDNNFDGDYFKARWAESGVLEADCLICHLPGYDHKARRKQIQDLNFRWAATAGAGFGVIKGSVAKGEKPEISYQVDAFLPDGKVALPIVREIPVRNCLQCHQEPDWKKKGASYSHRTDVHLRAGLKCVDCHVTGRNAPDSRIHGREMHQIGKGDDPTGLVRNDLDNTMRTCEDCHLKGEFRAKIPAHRGFPPRHLEKIACLTCHVPQRQVKAALLQDSTVFNAAPRIPAAGKRIWTFYGPDMKPWNLYGEADTFTAERQPLFLFEPVRSWYKGKIYPMNRIESIWIAMVDRQGNVTGQPYMKDLAALWNEHRKDPEKNWPALSEIRDDNGDGVPEVNRATEIQALVEAVKAFLAKAGEPLADREVVLVSGPRYTADGITWRDLNVQPEPWQYTPYSSVFKLSHDILPARSALGAGGCTDCHGTDTGFWNNPVMAKAFNGDSAETVWTTNARLLGVSEMGVTMGAVRHELLEPVLFYGMLAAFALLIMVILAKGIELVPGRGTTLAIEPDTRIMLAILGTAAIGPGIILIGGHILSSRAMGMLGLFHQGVAILLVAALLWAWMTGKIPRTFPVILACAGIFFMTVTGGILMFSNSTNLRQIIFTLHDMGAIGLCGLAAVIIAARILRIHKPHKDKENT